MIEQLNIFLELVIRHLPMAFRFIAFIWGIHLINMLSGYRLLALGIIPRFLPSLAVGPICAPLLHANTNHLAYNSLPLFALTCVLFSMGPIKALCIIISSGYLSGLLTWAFARRACHVGSSGLVMALLGFFTYQAYLKPDATSITVLIILVYYFGTLFLSFIPTDETISFEGHFFGLISGCIIAHLGCPSLSIYIASLLASFF